MKLLVLILIGCLSSLAQADAGLKYFSGATFEHAKTVQMVGVERTSENLYRENQVSVIVEHVNNQLRYCYEKALRGISSLNVESVFYFLVNTDGSIENVTADLINVDATTPGVAYLISCASDQLKMLKVPGWMGGNRSFRFRVSYDQR